MTRRSPQAQVALIAALIFVFVGFALLAVLAAGLVDGVTGTGPLLLGAVAIGVFALAFRLILLSRSRSRSPFRKVPTPTPEPAAAAALPPRQSRRAGSRPQPGPKGRALRS